MTRDDFRRELGSAFDDISGSPSAALSDRVRSALAEAPERRGPIWVAGIAAALIAVIIVGVLFVISPLNHRPNVAPGGATPTPAASPTTSASPTPTTSASPTPTSALPPFTCTSSPAITNQQPPLSATIDALRTASHTGYDRLTVEFSNGQPGSITVQPQSGTNFTTSPLGQRVTLAGRNGILVTINVADAHTAYTGPRDITLPYLGLVEVRVVQDFEGVVQLAMGINVPATCYRAFVLTNPTRLVIDIQVP